MSNAISKLQADFIDFAQGMPAVAISWNQIERDVEHLSESLKGVNPGQPSPYMGNVKMPVYSLAYSAFIELLTVKQVGNRAEMTVKLTANIHPVGRPDEVIRSYAIETDPNARLTLELDTATSDIYWQVQGGPSPIITPAWGANADAILATTSIPEPKRDNYLDEVERQIIWLTGPSFVRLVVDVLPRYKLSEIAPWLQFKPPLRTDLASGHIIITSSRATITVGDCTPETINIEPDPNFPYGEQIPTPTLDSSKIDFAVYSPKTRLVEFFAKKVEPAIMVSDSGGGTIKWSLAGSIGLKGLVIDLKTAQGLSGVLDLQATVDFVAAARAWVDGPSGVRLSLASASVLGSGALEANINLTLDVNAGLIEAVLAVKRSELPYVSWDVNTPLGWPLDAIASEILDHVSKDEIRKLARSVTQIGKWNILGLPIRYLDTIRKYESPIPYSEGLAGVSAFTAVTRRNNG